jgi:hypothetical protein
MIHDCFTDRFCQLGILWENNEVKDLIISAHGLLPILEILEPCTYKNHQPLILPLLKIVNTIILDDVELQENLCFVGGIPIITKFAARQFSNEIRLEAAAFVRQMYQTSTTTLQMFVSAGGLTVLSEFLDEDYDLSRDLVLIGVNGIWNVFELQGPTPKNDFCRIFSRSKILDPLAQVLDRVLHEDQDELSELIEGRIVNIFYLFSQAENYVKEEVVKEWSFLKSMFLRSHTHPSPTDMHLAVLKDLCKMTPIHRVTMLKFIKNLSMLSTTLDWLHKADTIDYLIEVLSDSIKKPQQHFREISNQVLNAMFNLCRLNKDRQQYAATKGIVPLLMEIMRTDRPPKEFVIPILCDMAHSGNKGRKFLWQHKALNFYVSMLADQYWQVTALDAIFIWLQEETARVEMQLLEGKFTGAIVSCFGATKNNAFDPNLLEPLLKVLRLSPSVAAALAKAEMYSGIAQKLGHKKAVVRLNLLRMVRSIMDACEGDGLTGLAAGAKQLRQLLECIQTLAEKDSAVLVRNLAGELVRSSAQTGNSNGDSSAAAKPPASRSRSGPRRRTSYTPPSLHNSVSAPPRTPTHRPSQSVSYIGASSLVEVVATPRRTALERESVYRPRSRGGDGISAAAAAAPAPRKASAELGGLKSRLPTRPQVVAQSPRPMSGGQQRSESSLSNKENVVGRRLERASTAGAAVPSSSTAASGAAAAGGGGSAGTGSGGKRRNRAPSADVRWA